MPSDSDISRELQAFGPYIVGLLDSADFFDLPEGPYDALEWDTKIKQQPEYKRYVAESKKKNSRVWDIVKSLFIPAAIGVGIATIRRDYKPQLAQQATRDYIKFKGDVPKRPTAQDYQNQYIRERGGEFITNMQRADQKQLTRFLWKNSGEHERPLAKRILKQEPTLAYLVDNKEYRLRTIKRTETHRATMYGSWQYSRDWGAETKTRGEAGDGRTRPSHRAQIGITVLINDPYPDGEQYPGEMSINCRGHNIFNFDKSKLTKDPQKVYKENLAAAEEDAKAVRKAELEAAKSKPVEISKAKPIGGEVIPRKVAPKTEPAKVTKKEEAEKVAPDAQPHKVARQSPIKFTFEERAALQDYTREDFSEINKYLRGQLEGRHQEIVDRAAKQAAHIDSAMKKGVLPEQTVYRALSNEDWVKNIESLKGATIHDKAFVSTSQNRKLAEGYAQSAGQSRILMEISVPKGSTGIDIIGSGASSTKLIQEESEVLLMRGSKFKVIGTGKVDIGMQTVTYIKAELIQ